MTNRLLSPLAFLMALLALPACGGFPAPVQHMATAQASVRAAEEVGAQQDPQAALHLKLAQEQLARAKQLMSDNDNKRADFILSRAEADAELAVALSRQAQTRAQAQQAMDDVRALKQKAGLQ
jgi:hypothetical protein